jgi:hypothetical protein
MTAQPIQTQMDINLPLTAYTFETKNIISQKEEDGILRILVLREEKKINIDDFKATDEYLAKQRAKKRFEKGSNNYKQALNRARRALDIIEDQYTIKEIKCSDNTRSIGELEVWYHDVYGDLLHYTLYTLEKKAKIK